MKTTIEDLRKWINENKSVISAGKYSQYVIPVDLLMEFLEQKLLTSPSAKEPSILTCDLCKKESDAGSRIFCCEECEATGHGDEWLRNQKEPRKSAEEVLTEIGYTDMSIMTVTQRTIAKRSFDLGLKYAQQFTSNKPVVTEENKKCDCGYETKLGKIWCNCKK